MPASGTSKATPPELPARAPKASPPISEQLAPGTSISEREATTTQEGTSPRAKVPIDPFSTIQEVMPEVYKYVSKKDTSSLRVALPDSKKTIEKAETRRPAGQEARSFEEKQKLINDFIKQNPVVKNENFDKFLELFKQEAFNYDDLVSFTFSSEALSKLIDKYPNIANQKISFDISLIGSKEITSFKTLLADKKIDAQLARFSCSPIVLSELINLDLIPDFKTKKIGILLDNENDLKILKNLEHEGKIKLGQIIKCNCKLYTPSMHTFFNKNKDSIKFQTFSINEFDTSLAASGYVYKLSFPVEHLIIKNYPPNGLWYFENVKKLTLDTYRQGPNWNATHFFPNLETLFIKNLQCHYTLILDDDHFPKLQSISIDEFFDHAGKRLGRQVLYLSSLKELVSVNIRKVVRSPRVVETSIDCSNLPKLKEIKIDPKSFVDISPPWFSEFMEEVPGADFFNNFILPIRRMWQELFKQK